MGLGGAGSNDNACSATNADALHKAIRASVDAGATYVVVAGNRGADQRDRPGQEGQRPAWRAWTGRRAGGRDDRSVMTARPRAVRLAQSGGDPGTG